MKSKLKDLIGKGFISQGQVDLILENKSEVEIKSEVENKIEVENNIKVDDKLEYRSGLLPKEINTLSDEIMALKIRLTDFLKGMKEAKTKYFSNILQKFKVLLFFYGVQTYLEKKIKMLQNANSVFKGIQHKTRFDLAYYAHLRENVTKLGKIIFPSFQYR